MLKVSFKKSWRRFVHKPSLGESEKFFVMRFHYVELENFLEKHKRATRGAICLIIVHWCSL